MYLNIVFALANGADPDEMLPCVTFYLGLHCLPKYLFTGIMQIERGYLNSLLPYQWQLLSLADNLSLRFKKNKQKRMQNYSSYITLFTGFHSWQ